MIHPFDKIEEYADQAAERHRLWIATVMNTEAAAANAPQAFSPRVISELERQLVGVEDVHLGFEQTALNEALSQMIDYANQEAVRQLGMQIRLAQTDNISMMLDFGMGEIEAQMLRDISQVMKLHRQRGHAAQLTADMNGLSVREVVIDQNIRAMRRSDRVWFEDRAGRRIASHKHIRRLWRLLLRDQYMMSFARNIALMGQYSARIVHPNPQHRAYGRVVTLGTGTSFLAEHEDIFHPNAQVYLVTESTYQEMNA
jgi:hypothetical protein